jgi:peptidoglycan-N-acetylglucosamine deacetylase
MTSARRYNKEGMVRTSLVYLSNYISMKYFNRVFRSPSPSFKYAMVAFLIVFASLTYVFAYPNPNPKVMFLGKVIDRINSTDKVVALTFDDGPNGKYTEEVLNILDREGIKATFFLVGKNVEAYPEITREIMQRGHIIGNHSYTHPWKLPFETKQSILNEVHKTENSIYNIDSLHTTLFRPPHGIRSPWMLNVLKNEGYEVITWDDMTIDYTKVKSANIANTIIKKVRPGSIIVLHDGLNLNHKVSRENTVEALDIIIKELKKENYKFVTLQGITNS